MKYPKKKGQWQQNPVWNDNLFLWILAKRRRLYVWILAIIVALYVWILAFRRLMSHIFLIFAQPKSFQLSTYGNSRRQEDYRFNGGSIEDYPTKPQTDSEGHLFVLLLWRKNRNHRFEWCW